MITLRKIEKDDRYLFAKWWRNKDLLKLTSGQMDLISDAEVDDYFKAMLKGHDDHYIILLDKKPIGHITLVIDDDSWYETQIIIDKTHWGQGYGPEAIRKVIELAHQKNINKIFLEVRPENTRAIEAYEKCSFKKTATLQHPNNSNQPITIRMELK